MGREPGQGGRQTDIDRILIEREHGPRRLGGLNRDVVNSLRRR